MLPLHRRDARARHAIRAQVAATLMNAEQEGETVSDLVSKKITCAGSERNGFRAERLEHARGGGSILTELARSDMLSHRNLKLLHAQSIVRKRRDFCRGRDVVQHRRRLNAEDAPFF
jgi:hypothetical protein